MTQVSLARITRHLPFYVLISGLFACGGGGGGGGGMGPPPPIPPPPDFGPVFSEIQASVFTPTCATSGCHSGANAPLGLRLDATSSFGLLVGVSSGQTPAVLRVAPGDPDNSYLIQKLEGTAAGGRMPLNATPLTQAQINVVRQWITDGAIDDRVQASDPIRITSLSPAPGAMLTVAPQNITAIFDRDPDASTVNVNTFVVEGSGGDGSFSDGNETILNAASISVPGANPTTAVFDLTGVLFPDDAYRVQLFGDGASVILDMDGNALDGEFTGNFLTGDGLAGGNFSATFDVMAPMQGGATLADIQATVFTPSCATVGCHSGPAANSLPAGMDLSSTGASFNSLVGISSLQQPALLRVASGDPDNSYLIQKLEGTAAVGVRMPAIGGPLSQDLVDNIRQWIADGAQQ